MTWELYEKSKIQLSKNKEGLARVDVMRVQGWCTLTLTYICAVGSSDLYYLTYLLQVKLLLWDYNYCQYCMAFKEDLINTKS